MFRALRRAATRTAASLRSLMPGIARGKWNEVHAPGLWDRALAHRLYTPAAAPPSEGMPLVVMLHGCKQDAQTFAAGTRMNQLADRHRFMVLYPEQSRGANPLRCWNWYRHDVLRGAGETALLAQLITAVRDTHPIDKSRVYVMGMSAGAAMARVLCVHHACLFAAAALHSGLMYHAAGSAIDALSAMRNGAAAAPQDTARGALQAMGADPYLVPTVLIHGDLDEVVNPVNAQRHVEQFTALADLTGMPLLPRSEARVNERGRHYVTQDFTRDGQLLLRHCVIEGLAHAWSGGDAHYPFNDAAGPHASELAWEFVSLFHLSSAADAQTTISRRPKLRELLSSIAD